MSGLQLWLDASDPYGNGTVPANGTIITTWTDKSGNGYNAVSPQGPTITTSESLNSLPGIAVDNSVAGSGVYYNSSIPPGTFLNSLTIFGVYKSKSNTAQNSLFGRGSTAYNPNYANPLELWEPRILIGFNNAVTYNSPVSFYQPNVSLYNLNINQTNSTVTQFINFSGGAITGSAWTASDIGNSFTIGTRTDNLDTNNAIYFEVLVFNTNLSTPQRQSVEGYLAWKWGLQASLPAGHPYLSASPIPSNPGWNVTMGGNRIAGSTTYKSPLSTTITNASGGTAMYEVGPITTTATSKLLITASLSLVAVGATNIQMTVGRYTATGATAAQSTNVVVNTTGVLVPYSSGASAFMASTQTVANTSATLNGTAIDSPGAGTFYYRIWASSVPALSSANSTITANLNVLQM